METRALSNGQHGTFASTSFAKYDVILSETVPILKVQNTEDDNNNNSKNNDLIKSIISSYSSLERSQRSSVLELYHPDLDKPQREEIIAVHRAKEAAKKYTSGATSGRECSIGIGMEEVTKVILVYLCNAFEGGLLFSSASRINHSCDPNCIYVIDESTITVKAITNISAGEEITVSYLGLFLWAGKPVRRAKLQREKYFTCECGRCCKGSDLASGIPCFKCNPREGGKYLKEEEQWEEVPIAYSYFNENDSLRCSQCDSVQEPSAGLTSIMTKVIDKVTARLSVRHDSDTSKVVSVEEMDINFEVDEQLFKMSLSVLGPKHWATNLMHLSLLDRSLSSFNAAMLLGEAPSFDELGESCDSLQRLWHYCDGLKLKVGSLPILFKQTLGVSRSLVSLGDMKSKKYASQWINRSDMTSYAVAFEREGMAKVVDAIDKAWQATNIGLELNSINQEEGNEMDVDDSVSQGRKKRVKS